MHLKFSQNTKIIYKKYMYIQMQSLYNARNCNFVGGLRSSSVLRQSVAYSVFDVSIEGVGSGEAVSASLAREGLDPAMTPLMPRE